MNSAYKTLGLTLSGGGTRGFAHIGFYKVLYDNQIPIHSMAGCSIGALVAAGIAQGKKPDDIFTVLSSFVESEHSFFRLKNFSLEKGSLLKASEELEMMEALIPAALTFEQLQIPLIVNAVDLEKGEIVIFKSGSVLEAVQASMSIPGIFPPILHDEKLLVDGGVLNSIPIDLCRMLGADIQIAVDLKSFYTEQNMAGAIDEFFGKNASEKTAAMDMPKKIIKDALLKVSFPFTILLRSVCIAEEAFRKRILSESKPDLLVSPDVSGYGFLDIEKYVEIFAKGTEAGELALPQIKKLLTQNS